MSSIRERTTKRGPSYFQVLYRHNKRQCSERFDTLDEAERWQSVLGLYGPVEALNFLYTEAENTDAASVVPYIHDAFTEIIDSMTGVKPGTRHRYRRVLVNDIEPFFGALSPVTVFCETVIGRWINHLAENVGNAAKTIANKHGVLFGILKKLARRGVIPSNPCEQTELPRVVRAEMDHLEPENFSSVSTNPTPVLTIFNQSKYKSEVDNAIQSWNSKGRVKVVSVGDRQPIIHVFDENRADVSYVGLYTKNADIRLNSHYMDTYGPDLNKNTVLHEMGHALGLRHSCENNIMFASVTPKLDFGVIDNSSYRTMWGAS
ncbi:M12 family metallopeptidase [Nocardia sp. NBC_01499]|uniref:M12 family metallopeptidase n=1 Tax=Nocardia sp. NBC_01499 TaxID=2903597 RepID=UPI00386816DC